MKHLETILAGFGGQGILSAGKILAQCGMIENMNASWYPSYGPEMRGGTANCNVIVSAEKIGSPIINNADALIVMNNPSLSKYEGYVNRGGYIIIDSSLVDIRSKRDDVNTFYIPATKIAAELGNTTFANIVLLGKLLKMSNIVKVETFEESLREILPPKKHYLIETEMKVLKMGMEY